MKESITLFMSKSALLAIMLALITGPASAADFDHRHTNWNELVQDHVVWIRGGVASEVDYASFGEDRAQLNRYLTSLSDVSEAQYQGWSDDQKLAFLINAYNAYTVELILTEYPDLDSIKDLGGFLSSPWSKAFFSLRGEERTLDEVEHEMIRVEFQEPRIHMAVNCASVGCPALADTAYVPDQLDDQLTKAEHRFMSDKTRNRYNSAEKTFEVSPIFKWYDEDWNAETGYPDGVLGFLSSHLERLSTGAVPQRFLVKGADIDYLDYDWALNDLSNSTDSS